MTSVIEFVGVAVLCAGMLAVYAGAAVQFHEEWGFNGVVAATLLGGAAAAALVLYA